MSDMIDPALRMWLEEHGLFEAPHPHWDGEARVLTWTNSGEKLQAKVTQGGTGYALFHLNSPSLVFSADDVRKFYL